MDNSERYDHFFAEIEKTTHQLGEKAAGFPSKEEYLEKDVQERLNLAKGILEAYASVPRYESYRYDKKWAKARIDPKDRQDQYLVGLVAYRPENRLITRQEEYVPEGIGIKVEAHDSNRGWQYGPEAIGELREGEYRDSEGEKQEGWHVRFKGSNHEAVTTSLDTKRGQDMVEFVDAAVVCLIDGVISEHRAYLGSQAVNEGVAVD